MQFGFMSGKGTTSAIFIMRQVQEKQGGGIARFTRVLFELLCYPQFLFKCKDPLESLTKLNMCISDIRVWMIKNKFKINDSKTEYIIFRCPLLKQNMNHLSVNVGDIQVSPSSKVRDLSVVFEQYLTFHDHISGICKSTHFHLRDIRIRNLLTFDATAQLIHALITSRLDFCNSILYNLPNKQFERLQRIQNQAARMLKRIPRRTHITPVLRELHWLKEFMTELFLKFCF